MYQLTYEINPLIQSLKSVTNPSFFHSKEREDEEQDRLFLTTRYGKRDRSYPGGNRLNKKKLTKFINTVEGNQLDGRNHFIEVTKAILELKSDLRIGMSYLHGLLDAFQRECHSSMIDLKNLEGPSGRML